MRIDCPYCRQKAKITHRVIISAKMSEAYITCLNPECGARSVMRIAHSHTLTPPQSVLTNSLYEQLAELDPRARRKLFETFQEDLPLFSR
ncbi:hypothetical protein SDC9_204895 [bioreactor metagenome]|uniref:Zinc finger Ogr/Delta-type domain-containing protein n=1 Tax=bioreactor metagenome TaxID=1076179 RepID=A0A645J0T8_9ZZZZ